MIKRVFIDTDIIMDVALARNPFFEASRLALAIVENNIALGFISSNGIANIYYMLRKTGGDKKARLFLSGLMKVVTVISIDHATVMEALQSRFGDFEDALQHGSAIRNQCDCIITRNTDDYQYSEINVYLPAEFLKLYQGKF